MARALLDRLLHLQLRLRGDLTVVQDRGIGSRAWSMELSTVAILASVVWSHVVVSAETFGFFDVLFLMEVAVDVHERHHFGAPTLVLDVECYLLNVAATHFAK